MEKSKTKKNMDGGNKKENVNLLSIIILLLYIYVTFLTPNLNTLDSNGPKFLALGILNFFTFIFILFSGSIPYQSNSYFAFFRNKIGIAYSGLILFSLLSFVNAFNLQEAILHFSKIFNVFTAAYLVSILIINNRKSINYLAFGVSILLIIDSLTVFVEIIKYIQGEISSVSEIISVYSHKNVFASAIFIKLPFAIYSIFFLNKWYKVVGIIGLIFGVLSVLFLSARSFYLGLFVLMIFIFIFFSIRFYKESNKKFFKNIALYFLVVVVGVLLFSIIQRNLYPEKEDILNKSITERLASIKTTESSTNARLEGWQRSWNAFSEKPILGVGLGNWKIVTLKEENFKNEGFNYQIKAHNDFIEVFTETGIFGGLFFISIFVFIWLAFIKLLIKDKNSDFLPLLFIPAFGMLCYAFDAFFNFPQDRPEIQSFFIIFIGITIAIAYWQFEKSKILKSGNLKADLPNIKTQMKNISKKHFDNANYAQLSIFGLFIVFLLLTNYFLVLNFQSLKLQRLVANDIKSGKLTQSANLFIEKFPYFPNLTALGLPISVQKARYLIKENRNEQAIFLMKNDKSNPYDALSKGLIAEAYFNLNELDSSIVYSRKCFELKPKSFKNINFLCNVFEKKAMFDSIPIYLNHYFIDNKNNTEAWNYAISFYYKTNKFDKAIAVLDSAIRNTANNNSFKKQKLALVEKMRLLPYLDLYENATKVYEAKNYRKAEEQFSLLLKKVPGYYDALKYRAFCYFYLNDFKKSNEDINSIFAKAEKEAVLINLRGVNFNKMGNKSEACKNFKKAAELGDKDGSINYSKLCK